VLLLSTSIVVETTSTTVIVTVVLFPPQVNVKLLSPTTNLVLVGESVGEEGFDGALPADQVKV